MADKGHVAVIGAGVVGVSTAVWLQRAGFRVTIIDRDGPAAGTSHGNAGVLAAASIVQVPVPGIIGKLPRYLARADEPVFLRWLHLPRLAPFLLRFLASRHNVRPTAAALSTLLHDSAEQHLALAAGTPAERFVERGDYIYAYASEAEMAADAGSNSLKTEHGHPMEVLDSKAFEAYDPTFEGRIAFAIRWRDHGRVSDPGAYVTALFDHAVSEGAEFVRMDVFDARDGVVRGANGEEIAADQIVVTAGIWSKALLERAGTKVPIIAERGYHMEFINPSIVPRSPTMIAAGKFVLTPMDGRLRAAGVAEFGPVDKKLSRAPLALLKRQTMRALPNLTYDEEVEWVGARPSTVDSLPLIGPVAEGLWAGFGHQHVGLTAGPKTGRWLAQLLSGETPNVDMAPFAADRFTA